MRILVDARTIGDQPSGVGMYGYNFIKGLLHLQENPEIYLVTDIAESPQIKELLDAGVPAEILGKKIAKGLALRRYFRFVQQTIHKVQPDVFWEINNLFPVKLANPYGKIVTTVHDLFPLTMPQCYGRIYPYYFRYGIRNMLRYTDAIVYNSEETRRDVEKFFPEAKEKEDAVLHIIIPYASARKKEESVSDQPYYFYLGNLEKRKGTDILLEGYRQYRLRGGRKGLYLAGKIREEEIQKQLDSVQTEFDCIHYVGYLSDYEKGRYLSHADCFLFPSRAEGFGIPVLEAMEYDCPVLVSDQSIFTEIIGDVAATFALVEDDFASAENLAEQMMWLDQMDVAEERRKNHDRMQRVLGKYREDVLAGKMMRFLEGIV